MADFGLTNKGFVLKRLPDIKLALETNLKAVFGDINTAPESVFGQLIGTFAKELADVWEQNQNIYNAQNPSAAEGASLDDIVQYIGLARKPATQSSMFLIFYGDEGTVISTDKRFSVDVTHALFFPQSTITISRNFTNEMNFKFTGFGVDVTYAIQIDGKLVQHTVGLVTLDQFTDIFVDAINSTVDITMTATKVVAGEIKIKSKLSNLNHIIEFVTPLFDITLLGTAGKVLSVTYGKIAAPAKTCTTIETPITGLDSVINELDAIIGTDVESDTELRLRRIQSLARVGTASVEAIRSRLLQEISSVTNVTVFENTSDTIVNGRPPHSFEAVISGNETDEEDLAIASLLWQHKPAGIVTCGNAPHFTGTGISILDTMGFSQVIHFSRPVPIDIDVVIRYTVDPEGGFPVNGIALIKSAVLNFGLSLPLGKDVVLQQFQQAVFGVSGLLTAVIEMRKLPAGAWITTDKSQGNYGIAITIAAAEIARFSSNNILVIEA